MDPLTLAASFATVVGLVSDFMSQRSQVWAQDNEHSRLGRRSRGRGIT